MTDLRKELSERPPTTSKYAGLGADIAVELMIGFWFGAGVISDWGGRLLELLHWGTCE